MSRLSVAAFTVPLTLASILAANESEPPKEVRLEAPPQSVTVTATRTPTELRQLGRAVTVITREELVASGAATVAEVLEGVPGIFVARTASYGGPTSVFVRGGESDFNLVMVDGVPVNRPGGEFDFSALSTANVERIEVVRGPGSVLYGTEAVASTIHVISRRHRSGGSPSGGLSFLGGSHGTLQLGGNVSAGSERAQFSFGGLTSDTDGIFDFNSAWRRSELSAGGSFLLGPRSTLTTSMRYTDSRQEYPTDDFGAIVDPNDFRESREQVYGVGLQHRVTGAWSSRIHYGYHRNNAFNHTVRDDITDFWDDVFQADDDRHYGDWQNTVLVLPGHELTAGATWKRETSRTAAESRRSLGVYLQDRMSWRDRFFLSAGIRAEDSSRFSGFVTGNLDGAWLVTDRLKLRAAVSNGFRAPAFSEILGFPAWGILGNPTLRPEKNVAAEFGADWVEAGGARLSGTVFLNRYSDLIEFTFAGPPSSPNFLNVEAARSRGVEIDAGVPVRDRIRLGAAYTWTTTRVTDAGTTPFGNFEEGLPLLRRPRHLAGVWTQFDTGWSKARVDFRYKGARDDRQFFPDFSSARVVLGGYWRMDLAVSVPLKELAGSRQQVSLVLRGQNLLNRRYTEIAGFPSPGRGIFGGLEWGF